MKIFKYFVFSFVIFFFVISVFAEDTLIKGVTLKEVSGDVVVGDTLIDGDTIQPDIVFYDEGDSVSFQIDLNYDTNLYLIDSIKDNNENDFVKTNYSYKEDKVFMTIFYDEKVSSSFELEPITLKILFKEKAVNPKTGYSDWIIILFVCFVLVTFFYSLIRYKKSIFMLLILFPIIVFAKDNNIFEITINTEKIKVSYTVHFHKSDDITGEMEDISCVPGEGCTLPEVTFQKDGNFFVGWALSIDGESVYLNQENVENFMELLENNEVTLYPLWAQTINNFDYTGAVQTYIVPRTGYYKLEVWGAQGGTSYGGKGGYSYGIISLTSKTVLYVYVGHQGDNGFKTNAFNGGGAGYGSSASASSDGSSTNRGGGGGATDIRILSDSLYARVIVAGGGGGGFLWTSGAYNGSYGGGTSGVLASERGNPEGKTVGQASQLSGGVHGYGYGLDGNGSFGMGGNGFTSANSGITISGGGGGWYGGGGSNPGWGGSGWIYTASSYNNWATNSVEGQSGNWLLDSSYYLTDAETIAGDQSFPSPGGGTETGHSGNGYARITYIED